MANIPFLNNAYFAAKVGIGVPTPNESLEVSGSILLSSRLKLGTGDHYLQQTSGDIYSFTTGKNIMYAGSAEVFRVDEAKLATFKGDAYFNSGLITTIDSTGSFYIDVNANNDYGGRNFRVLNNGTTYFNIDAGGNVGIGTTAPLYKLDINETTTNNLIVSRFTHNQSGVASAVQLENRAGAVNSAFDINWGLNSSGNQGTIGVVRTNLPAAGGSEMYFKTSYGEVMRIDGSGNVGIGTTSPQRNLTVYESSGNAVLQLANSTSGVGASDGFLAYTDGVNVGLENKENGYLSLATNASEKIRITSAGNVGIGTYRPNEKLQVGGNIHIWDREGGTNRALYVTKATTVTTTAKINSDGDSYLNGGNVGIGTTSPSEKLEVDGIIKVVHTDDSYANYRGQGVFFNRTESYLAPLADNTSTLNIGYNGAKWGNIEINGAFIKFENGPNEFMRIDSSGNVGIGTTSPTSPLTIKSNSTSSSSSGLTIQSNSNTNNIFELAEKSTDGARLQMYDAGVAKIALYTDGTNNYINAGNVGIGTTSPSDKLEIGNLSNYTGLTLKGAGASRPAVTFKNVSQSLLGSIYGTESRGMIIETGGNGTLGTVAMTLSSTGALKLNTYTAGTLVSDASGNITVSSGGGAGGPYLPLAGGTMTGNTKHNDNVFSYWGNNDDLAIRHNATDTYIENYTGDLQIVNYADDKDIIFKSDDGSGGTATYFRVDGGAVETRFLKSTRHFDDVGAYFGDSADLQIYHTGNDSYIKDAGTGDLRIVASLTKIYDADMSHLQASFTDGGSVDLYYSGNKKFETTNTGIKTGNIDLPSNGAILFDNTNNTEQYYIRNGGGSQSSFQIGKGNPGSDIKLIIDDGGNVGIGTTSPNKTLELGYSNTEQNVLLNGLPGGAAGTGVLIFNNDTSTANPFANIDFRAGNADARIAIQRAGSNSSNFHFITDNANTFGTKMFIEHDGNVGIGTTAPSSRLTVQAAGSQTTQRAITIFHDNTLAEGYASIGAQYTATNGYIDSEIRFGSETLNGACSFMSFATGCNNTITQGSNSERMRITSGGNVGIGTSSPSAKLEVLTTTTNKFVRFRADNNEQRFEFYVGASGNASRMSMHNDAATETIRFASAGNSYFNGGSVGIGTTSPGAKLHLADSSDVYLTLESTSATTAEEVAVKYSNQSTGSNYWWAGLNQSANYSLAYGTAYSGANVKMEISTAGNATFAGNVTIGDNSASEIFLAFNSSATDFALGANGSNFMIGTSSDLDSGNLITLSGANGRLGIGTTSPQSKLQVAGGIQMANDTATASAAKVGTMRYRTGTEYVEVTGTEILPNPGFDTDTNWVKGTGWTIANGKASVDNASSTALSQPSFGVTTGKIYNVRIDVSNYTSGSLQVQFGASQVIASIGANGEYNYTVTSTITGGTFYLYGVGDCEFSVDNASVIEVEAEDASYADMCMQTGSSTYEWVNIVRNTY
jgi:hypothetical protein